MSSSLTITHPTRGELEVEYDIESADPDVGIAHAYANITSVRVLGDNAQVTLTMKECEWLQEKCDEAIYDNEGDNYDLDRT
jgi:hypothetical protein